MKYSTQFGRMKNRPPITGMENYGLRPRSWNSKRSAMHAIRDFCEKRMLNKKLTDAFISYCKSHVSDYYHIGNGQTVTGILISFNDQEIEKLWQAFVADLRAILPQEGVP
jgi:hypothetical protein